MPAVIPTDYIAHLPARLAFYQRLTNVANRDNIPAVRADLQDRFGPLPPMVENLLAVTDLRCLGRVRRRRVNRRLRATES